MYKLCKIGNAYDVSFGLTKGYDFKLISIIPKETIFTNLKTLIYIVLSFTNKENLVCTFTVTQSDKDGEVIDVKNMLNLQFLPAFEKASKIYQRKNSSSLYSLFKEKFLDKFSEGKNLTQEIEEFFKTMPEEAKKYKQPIID